MAFCSDFFKRVAWLLRMPSLLRTAPLAILQRQSTPRAIWKRRLSQFVEILLAMLILPFYFLWRLAKKLIRN
ncbi:MAG: hypothetical protein RM338_13050 [Nostoc sp. DedQUE12a]|nr:hypothetical protein [Nostoc sp. DedQUE12a]